MISGPNWSTNPLNSVTSEEEELAFVGPQNLVPVLTGPVEMLLRPLHPGTSILFRNQRSRFTVETDGRYGEFKKTFRLIARAEMRNTRLCHAERSCQRHHGQSILTTHN
ncbi:unnamed protein product [Caenorhabditis auriculariae]|uniref:Uncharacterized protein n=1 Tax=Caenorhabditis auriculariae TaxID=2777116 RepID=A0A8S1HBJ1_9PELO|nr:unnamed protein product [Caenorhabditis auriculariae]